MPTIVTDPKVLAAKYNQAFNSHDEAALRSLVAPNARFSAPGDVRLEGKDAVIGYTNSWMKALPDTGPLTGPMGTIQATNRTVSGQCVQLLTQLGVMPVASKN
jgi:hypothetical protein